MGKKKKLLLQVGQTLRLKQLTSVALGFSYEIATSIVEDESISISIVSQL